MLTALALAFNLTDGVQRAVPGYTDALQNRIETGRRGEAGARRGDRGVNLGPDRDLSPPTARRSRSAARRPRSPASAAGSTRLTADRSRSRA